MDHWIQLAFLNFKSYFASSGLNINKDRLIKIKKNSHPENMIFITTKPKKTIEYLRKTLDKQYIELIVVDKNWRKK